MKRKRRFKRIRKRIMTAALSLIIGFNAAVVPCKEVKAAEVVAAYGTAEFIASLAASVGVVIGIDHLIGRKSWEDTYPDYGSPTREQDVEDIEKMIEKSWEIHLQEYMDANGITPTPSPNPTATPAISTTPEPGVTPEPSQLPATYDEVKSQATSTGLLAMSAATYAVVEGVIDEMWNNIFHVVEVKQGNMSADSFTEVVGIVKNDSFPYYQIAHYSTGDLLGVYMYGPGSFMYYGDELFFVNYNNMRLYRKVDGDFQVTLEKNVTDINNNYKPDNGDVTNLPIFSTADEGLEWRNSVIKVGNLTGDDVLYTPAHSDSFNNSTSLNLPSTVPPTIKLPTLEELIALREATNEDEENSPVIVQNFITNHYVSDSGGDDSGDDDTGGNTGGSTGGGTGSGDGGDDDPFNPEVTPSPDDENSKYLAPDLKDFFPFCIPFDIYDVFSTFSAERKAPCFTFHLKSEKFDFDHEIVIDLSVFDDVAALLRTLELVLFVILLAVGTRKLIGA